MCDTSITRHILSLLHRDAYGIISKRVLLKCNNNVQCKCRVPEIKKYVDAHSIVYTTDVLVE